MARKRPVACGARVDEEGAKSDSSAPAKVVEASTERIVQPSRRLVVRAAASLQQLVPHLGGQVVERQPVVRRPFHAAQRVSRNVAVPRARHAGGPPDGVGLRAVVKRRVSKRVRPNGGGRKRQLPADARARVGRRKLRLAAVRVAMLAQAAAPVVGARGGVAGRAAKGGGGVGASRRVDVGLQRVEDGFNHAVLLRVGGRGVVLLHQQLRSGGRERKRERGREGGVDMAGARVWVSVARGARYGACERSGLVECALVCVGVRWCALVCVGVRGCAWVCRVREQQGIW